MTERVETTQPFPAYEQWLDRDGAQGLVARAQDIPIAAETMLAGYCQGIFPWSNNDWYSPKMRGVYFIPEMSFSRESLHIAWKRAKKGNYSATFNKDFEQVVRACASATRRRPGAWLSEELIRTYTDLYNQGYGLSVEIWDNDEQMLAGNFGIYCNGHFHAESLFGHHLNANQELARRASGMGMLSMHLLVELLYSRRLLWIDIQTAPEGTYKRRLGGKLISRDEYLNCVIYNVDPSIQLLPGTKRGEPLPTVVSDIFSRDTNPFSAKANFPWLSCYQSDAASETYSQANTGTIKFKTV